MKKGVMLLILIFLTSCGSQNISSEEQKVRTQENLGDTDVLKSEQENLMVSNEEIILTMFSTDDCSIEEYVQQLNQNADEQKYRVYDSTHYSYNVSDKERKDFLTEIESDDYIEQYFQELFADTNTYNGAFISISHNEDFTEFKFYVDKSKYDAGGLGVLFAPSLLSNMIGDTVQAYYLVPVESRSITVKIIDNETEEIIYNSDDE